MWPGLKIVHGKPRHSQSQGSVERANQDVRDMVIAWQQQNNTKKWSEGLRFVQFQKNSCHHQGIKRSPYNAMFGMDPKLGLKDCRLPPAIVDKITNEDELQEAISHLEQVSIFPQGESTKNRIIFVIIELFMFYFVGYSRRLRLINS
jgi:hypothetical protein